MGAGQRDLAANRVPNNRRGGRIIDADRRVAEVLSYQHQAEMFDKLVLQNAELVREQAEMRNTLKAVMDRCEELLTQIANSRMADVDAPGI